MTDDELKIYMKKRQQQFADSEILLAFEGLVNEILKMRYLRQAGKHDRALPVSRNGI
jgi:hypothetical protein